MNWNEEDIEEMTTDFHRSSIGRFIVDISWQPEKDTNGEFHCRVILDGNWDHPLEELRTKDTEKMTRWAFAQMKEASRRGGPDGNVEPQDVR